jgi:hypothetical protein
VQVIMGIVKATLVLSIVGIIFLLEVGNVADTSLVLQKAYHAVSMLLAATATSVVAATGIVWSRRMREVRAAGLTVTARRGRSQQAAAISGTATLVASVAVTLGHIAVLIDKGALCKPRLIACLFVIQNISWNTVLLVNTISVHWLLPVVEQGQVVSFVIDRPWSSHWRKGILWVVMSGASPAVAALTCQVPALYQTPWLFDADHVQKKVKKHMP